MGQTKVLKEKQGGTIHTFIFYGMIVLLVGTFIRFLESDFLLKFLGVRIVTGLSYLAFKLAMNIAGIIVILGVIFAFIRRILKTYRDLPTKKEDYFLLSVLLFIVVTGFVLSGLNTLDYRVSWISYWDLVGYPMALLFKNWTVDYISLYRVIWIVHLTSALSLIALIPFTKLSHILISGVASTFFSRLGEPILFTFKQVPELDKMAEEGKAPGLSKLRESSWRQRLDFEACVECARCHNNCPATLTKKGLSPMKLLIDMKKELRLKNYDERLLPTKVGYEIIWACTTCGACVEVCPVLNNPLEFIIDLRRYACSIGEGVPPEIQRVLYNIMKIGNPFNYSPVDRENYLKLVVNELGIQVAEEGKEYDYILWLGCNASYDPNVRNSAYSLMKILKKAGINFAILPDETCCGEPARRIGDEYLFKQIIELNLAYLRKYRFKKLLVMCPHGYTVFKHDYNQYNNKINNIEVEHYTILLHRLLKNGLIRVRRSCEKVVYHDPCYLARWNNITNEPREVIRSVAELVEATRSRKRTFCCGSGGGGYFLSTKIGERISRERMSELSQVGANRIVVSCPFCNIMLRSEILDRYNGVEVVDLAELIDSNVI